MFDTSHLHPMLVHFPIALAMVGLLFEIARFFFSKKIPATLCGEFMLYVACLSAIAAVLSGEFFTGKFTGEPLDVRDIHRMLAIISTISLILASIVYLIRRFKDDNNKGLEMLGLSLYILSALLIGITGFMGGNLVYSYMIGL